MRRKPGVGVDWDLAFVAYHGEKRVTCHLLSSLYHRVLFILELVDSLGNS